MSRSVTVTTPSEREIVLSREFHAPRDLVFEALTTPELLLRWYGARGWNLVTCEVDLRAGGAYRFVSAGPDGARMVQSGVYTEILPAERLACTEVFEDQSYPGETLITHRLTEHDGVTTLTSVLLYATRQGRDRVLAYPMARGVGESYDRLDAILTDHKGETS
jgi:uncharacterized protein YndB with AHSA1/START domain